MDLFALITVSLLYLGITVYLGWLGFKHTRSARDYYTAGGEVNPYLMAMGYGAAFISTSAIVGFGGAAAVYGMSLLWLTVFNIIAGIFIAFVWIGRRTRAMGRELSAQTFPELLGKRYNSTFVRKFSAIVITASMPLYAAAVMIGGARFMEMALNVNYSVALLLVAAIVGAYVLAGGMKGVLYTSAFQGTLMLIVMLVLLVFTYNKLGGVTQAHSALASMNHLVPEGLLLDGHRGWTAMPAAFSRSWYFVITTLVFGVGIGVLAQPQLAVRYMTVKSNKELYRALVPGGLFILLMTGVGFTVGALSNVYFYESIGKIALTASINPLTNLPNTDTIIPLFITSTLPVWVGYVFMLTLLSAAMSTLSGQFHSIATSVSYDLYQSRDIYDQARLKLARYGTVFGLIVTVILSYVLPVSIVAIATAIFFGLCASGFLPLYLFGLFWKKVTTIGATIGMVSGTFVYLFIMLFMYVRMTTIFKLSELIFGKTTIVNFPFNVIDPIVYALPVSLVVTVVVSLMTQSAVDSQHVNKCFAFSRKKPIIADIAE
jgi:solute:Na+ symporter, SSS family